MDKLTYLLHFVGVQIDPNRVGIPQQKATQSQFDNGIAGAFVLAGAICVVFVVIGGFRYVISEGEPGKIKQAKDTVIFALAGLAVTAIGYILVRVVIDIARG